MHESATIRVGVVIPCYRVKNQILDVIARIPQAAVEKIYVIDDSCPEETGNYVLANVTDPRIVVITHAVNQGVGGAMVSGYLAAIADGIDIIVKIDGDGQMNPALLPTFIAPIAEGRADYTKGNRFFELESLRSMPTIRLMGNAALSLINKLSTGYWDIMDPTNGYTAIHARIARRIPLPKLSKRYFFESDILFRLGTLRAVVVDIPMDAVYRGEPSSMLVKYVALDFMGKYISRIFKRIFYSYFLRDFNAGTVMTLLGSTLFLFGFVWSLTHWINSLSMGVAATSGTVMVGALPILIGGHLLISAVNFDIANVPRRCIHKLLD